MNICTSLNQEAYDVELPALRCQVQRCLSASGPNVNIDATLQQELRDVEMSTIRGVVERNPASDIPRKYGCTAVDQKAHYIEVPYHEARTKGVCCLSFQLSTF